MIEPFKASAKREYNFKYEDGLIDTLFDVVEAGWVRSVDSSMRPGEMYFITDTGAHVTVKTDNIVKIEYREIPNDA